MVNSQDILQEKKNHNSTSFQYYYWLEVELEYFAEQCTPLKNSNVLPINQTFLTQSRLTSLDFNEEEILKIIRALNIHKAHGHDDISIRMIKICDKSLLKPLTLLFQNSAKLSYYPDIRKKSNIIPVHKKNDKQLVKNYRPISLLPTFGKSFEKIIFNKIHHFLLENLAFVHLTPA